MKLRQKGSEGINNASRLRGDDIKNVEGQTVHVKCRCDYINHRLIQLAIKQSSSTTSASGPTTRAKGDGFRFDGYKDHCFFCGLPAKIDNKRRGHDVHFVKTGMEKNAFQATIERVCKERNDTWGETVYARIQYIKDLRAADAVYHQMCSTNFRTHRQVPAKYKRMKPSQQTTLTENETVSHKQQAFLKVCDFLENCDEEQTTVVDLVQKMEEWCEEAYSATHLKHKLEEIFGSNIFISSQRGYFQTKCL